MAHFWNEGCPWCEEYEKTTYTTPEFAALTRKFVAVRVRSESLGQKFGVRGYPTLLFLTGNGEVVGRIQGFVSADALEAEWKEAARRAASLRAQPKDARMVADRLAVAAAQRDEKGVVQWQKRLAAMTSVEGDLRAAAHLAAAVFYEEELRQADAVPLFEKALSAAESPRLKAYARLGVVRCLLSVDRFAECVKHLEAALAGNALYASDRELALRLLKLAREKGGVPPPSDREAQKREPRGSNPGSLRLRS